MQMPQPKTQAVTVMATVGAAFGGVAAGALLGAALCGETGAAIGGLAFMFTFAAGYGMWTAYALAQAHGSILKLLFSAFRRKKLDREEWRAELARMWERALRASFLFWLNALWIGALAAIAMALCARSFATAAATFVTVLAYGIVLGRLARRGYLSLPEE